MHRHPEVLGRLISWTGLFQSLPYPWMVTSPFGDHAWSHLAWPLRASTLALRHQLFLSTFLFVFKQTRELPPPQGVKDAYVLLNLGDSVTTDHISPAGSIARNSAAARYLSSRGSALPLLRVVMIAGVVFHHEGWACSVSQDQQKCDEKSSKMVYKCAHMQACTSEPVWPSGKVLHW